MQVCQYVCMYVPRGDEHKHRQFIWHVLVYMACVSLYGMCQFIWHVSVYMACVSLYGMFQFIWHMTVYRAFVSLYGMCQFIWHQNFWALCARNSRLTRFARKLVPSPIHSLLPYSMFSYFTFAISLFSISQFHIPYLPSRQEKKSSLGKNKVHQVKKIKFTG